MCIADDSVSARIVRLIANYDANFVQSFSLLRLTALAVDQAGYYQPARIDIVLHGLKVEFSDQLVEDFAVFVLLHLVTVEDGHPVPQLSVAAAFLLHHLFCHAMVCRILAFQDEDQLDWLIGVLLPNQVSPLVN